MTTLPSEPLEVTCPYCWQQVPVEAPGVGMGELVVDCEVCCRPIRIAATGDRVEARRENE